LYQWYGRCEGSIADAKYATAAMGPRSLRTSTRRSTYCSNTVSQNEIVDQIIKEVPLLTSLPDQAALKRQLRVTTSLGQLIQFSRAVHAEMDAVLSAARQGISPVGSGPGE